MSRSGSPSQAPSTLYFSSCAESTSRKVAIVPIETWEVSALEKSVGRARCSICSSSALRRIRTACICLAALNSKFSRKSPYDRATPISFEFSGIFLFTISSYSACRLCRLLQETTSVSVFSSGCAPVAMLSSSGYNLIIRAMSERLVRSSNTGVRRRRRIMSRAIETSAPAKISAINSRSSSNRSRNRDEREASLC